MIARIVVTDTGHFGTERSVSRKKIRIGVDAGIYSLLFCRAIYKATGQNSRPPIRPSSNNIESTLPTSSSNLDCLAARSPADELSLASDKLRWSKPPEMGAIEKMAERAAVSDYYTLDDLLETSAADRAHVYNLVLAHKGAWARIKRKIFDYRASPQPSQRKTHYSFREVNIFLRR